MNVVFLGIGIFVIGIIIFALMLLLRGDGAKEQKLMQYFLLGALVQNAGYLLELTAPTMEAAIVAVKMQYLGSLTIPISYCHFIFNYCNGKTPKKILGVLKIVDLFIFFLILTCDLHHMYYRSIQWMESANGHGYLRLEYAAWLLDFYTVRSHYSVCSFPLCAGSSLYQKAGVCSGQEMRFDSYALFSASGLSWGLFHQTDKCI